MGGRHSAASIKINAVRSLALLCRRSRRYDEAATFWRAALEAPGCPPTVIREASEALSIHHEHRDRDLPVARAFALKSLLGLSGVGGGPTPARHQVVRHRLARIEEKMNRSESSSLEFSGSRLER